MGNGLCHYHEHPLILCCAAVCSRTLHPVGMPCAFLSHLSSFMPQTKLILLHPMEAAPCRSIPCAASAAPMCVQAAIIFQQNTWATWDIWRKCWLFLQQWPGEGILCLQAHVNTTHYVSLGLSIKEERAAPSIGSPLPYGSFSCSACPSGVSLTFLGWGLWNHLWNHDDTIVHMTSHVPCGWDLDQYFSCQANFRLLLFFLHGFCCDLETESCPQVSLQRNKSVRIFK